jgi:hypothetical protein
MADAAYICGRTGRRMRTAGTAGSGEPAATSPSSGYAPATAATAVGTKGMVRVGPSAVFLPPRVRQSASVDPSGGEVRQSRRDGGARPMALEKHYRIPELAVLLGFSDRTCIKLFEHEPGVIRLGADEDRKRRRRYVTLSVPESVVLRVHERLANQTFQANSPASRPLRIIRLRDLNAGMSKQSRHVLKLKAS